MLTGLQSAIYSGVKHINNRNIQSFGKSAYNKSNSVWNAQNMPCDTISFSANSRKDISLALDKHDNPVRIVFSDIDGTIADEGVVPKSAKIALKQLQENDIPIVITTGRTFEKAKDKIESMGINFSDNDFIITQQGAVITDGAGKVLHQKTIKHSDVMKIIKTAEDYVNKTGDEAFELLFYVDGKAYSKTGKSLHEQLDVPHKIESYEELMDEKGLPTKIVLCKKDSRKISDMDEMREYFSKCLNGQDLNLCATCDILCEITDGEVSKGAAMSKVSELSGVKLRNAACIGDAENDVKMMEAVSKAGGFSVAMGNGQKCAKDAARFITGDISSNGYKQAIDTILANNERLLDA